MKKLILLAAILAIAWPTSAQFDFRSTGTQTMTNLAINLSTQPALAPTGKIVCYGDSSTLTIKCSVNGGPYADIGAGVGGSGVSSVFGRSGAVVANAGDYLATQVTATPFGTIAGTNVQTQLQQIDAKVSTAQVLTVFGRTGNVVATAGDYLASQVTNVPAGSVAAATVQAAIDEIATEKADRTVATTVTAPWTFNFAGAALLIKPASGPSANTKLLELRNIADSPLFSADYEGDIFAAGGATINGNVGIGTSPSAPLHVFTSGVSTTAFGNTTATLRSGAAGRDITLQFNDTTNTGQVSLLGSSLLFGTAGTERMRVNSTGLGIGVAPTSTLDVNGISTFRNFLSVGAAGVQGFITWDGAALNTLNVLAGSGKALSLGSNGVHDRVILDTSGNVGIGVTPTGKFHVKGAGSTSAPGTSLSTLENSQGLANTNTGLGITNTGFAGAVRFHGILNAGGATAKAVIYTGAGSTQALSLDESGNAVITGTIKERGRSVATGEPTAVAYNASNFTAAGGGTWTVASGDMSASNYTLIGKRLFWDLHVINSTTSGTVSNLVVTLPGGFTPLMTQTQPIMYYDGTSWKTGYVVLIAGNGSASVFAREGATFPVVTDNVYVSIKIDYQIN